MDLRFLKLGGRKIMVNKNAVKIEGCLAQSRMKASLPKLLPRGFALWQFCAACFVLVLILLPEHAFAAERIRLMIETDAGGDPDDEQSFVRFLLYSNEWDVEGIIATRPH